MKTASAKMIELQKLTGLNLNTVHFLLDAVELVIACRGLLQVRWSCVRSFVLVCLMCLHVLCVFLVSESFSTEPVLIVYMCLFCVAS